jgi:hypothetical protein
MSVDKSNDVDLLLDIKLHDVKMACIEIGFWDATKIMNGLHTRKCASRDKMLCTLFHIYRNHNHGLGDEWIISNEGLLHKNVHIDNTELSSFDKPWYTSMRNKWDYLLSPLPIYDSISGCYKIIENGNVIATCHPSYTE